MPCPSGFPLEFPEEKSFGISSEASFLKNKNSHLLLLRFVLTGIVNS